MLWDGIKGSKEYRVKPNICKQDQRMEDSIQAGELPLQAIEQTILHNAKEPTEHKTLFLSTNPSTSIQIESVSALSDGIMYEKVS